MDLFLTRGTKASSGPSRAGPARSSRPFAPPRACACLADAWEAESQINDKDEVSFDTVLAASQHAIGLWSRLHGCQACSRDAQSMQEVLFLTYKKLITLLEAAAPTCIAAFSSVSRSETAEPGGVNPATTTLQGRASSLYLKDQQDTPMVESPPSPAITSVVCLCPPMFLGEFELDEHQSRLLARNLLQRILKRIGAILYRMQQVQAEVATDLDGQLDSILSRILNLLGTVAVASPSSLDDGSGQTCL